MSSDLNLVDFRQILCQAFYTQPNNAKTHRDVAMDCKSTVYVCWFVGGGDAGDVIARVHVCVCVWVGECGRRRGREREILYYTKKIKTSEYKYTFSFFSFFLQIIFAINVVNRWHPALNNIRCLLFIFSLHGVPQPAAETVLYRVVHGMDRQRCRHLCASGLFVCPLVFRWVCIVQADQSSYVGS